MTKRLAMAFGLGSTLPLLVALYAGGENVAQAGLRLVAIEQGFSLAARHWTFEATPSHEPELVAQVDPVPAAKSKKGRR